MIVAWALSLGRAFGVCQHCDNLHQMIIKNGSLMKTMTRKKANKASVYAISYPIGSDSGFFDILILTTALLLDAAVFKTRNTHNVLSYNVPLMICTFLKRRTVSSAMTLPHHLCTSQERSRLLSSMPTISTRTPLGCESRPTCQAWKWSPWCGEYDCLRRFTFGWISKVLKTDAHRFSVKGYVNQWGWSQGLSKRNLAIFAPIQSRNH